MSGLLVAEAAKLWTIRRKSKLWRVRLRQLFLARCLVDWFDRSGYAVSVSVLESNDRVSLGADFGCRRSRSLRR